MIGKGQMISDRYEIIRSIGEGGMANVYLARDVILNRKVALKVLRGDLATDEKFVRRFQREALSASSLSHPNIVEMYDVGEDDGNYFIVMEYVEGKTLKQLLKKRGTLTLSETIDIMLQLTDGIAHAHDSYIIHRDLKPQNIMIQEDGLIKITDFGIAMALNSTQLTQTNSVMGSVHYLPPEQASGKGSTVKSDIYSMGILFYELLTGMLPFKGDNAVEIALKHMKDPLPSIKAQNPSIPQSIENIIMKSTAKNPKNRYDNVRQMHDDLLTALDEDRLNEPVYTYKYPEHESSLDKTIEITKKRAEKNANLDDDGDDTVGDKKSKKFIWILSGILGTAIIALLVIFIIIPKVSEKKDVRIPDVSGMTVTEAEDELKKAGFDVAVDTEKVASEDIESGSVVKTSPSIGRTVKEGTEITLYESIGKETLVIEDYTGMNYIEVKTKLELSGIVVTVEEKEVKESSEYVNKEQLIIEQSVKPSEKLVEGDKITLYIPKVVSEYPDMVKESWTIDDVEAFCKKYSLTPTYVYKETSVYDPGVVMAQSRTAGSDIVTGSTIKITIAKEVAVTSEEGTTNDDSVNSGATE